MKLKSFLLLTVAIATMQQAQAQSFEKGDNVITLGAGFGGYYTGLYSSYSAQTPAIGVAYEHAMNFNVGPGVLGMGGYIGHKSLRSHGRFSSLNYDYDYRWTYTIIGFRTAYHWNEWHHVDKLDMYAGLMLGYNVVAFRDKSDYPSDVTKYSYSSASGMGVSGYAGARYYFTDAFGVFGEVGFGHSYITLGAALKF